MGAPIKNPKLTRPLEVFDTPSVRPVIYSWDIISRISQERRSNGYKGDNPKGNYVLFFLRELAMLHTEPVKKHVPNIPAKALLLLDEKELCRQRRCGPVSVSRGLDISRQ